MKKIICFIFIFGVTLRSIGADDGVFKEKKNLNINFNTHEATLGGSEKVTPVYTEIKYNFNKDSRVSPFIKGDFGFSYVDEMEKDGKITDMTSNTYSSMGVGVDVGYLSLEAAYTNYEIGYQEDTEETNENRMMLKLKYRY